MKKIRRKGEKEKDEASHFWTIGVSINVVIFSARKNTLMQTDNKSTKRIIERLIQ